MAKFNIYKIRPNQEMALRAKFSSVNLREQKEKSINDWSFTFFFSQVPDEVDIWWVKQYKDFLNDPNQIIKNQIFYGVLLARKDEDLFAVSLGKSHFYIRDYNDQDFGLELAERIADEDDVKIKNTKFFKNKRNKVITSYVNNSKIDFESGESMHFLKAKSIDIEKWGQVVNFGQSVLFSMKCDYTRLASLLDNIVSELKKPSRFPLPKVVPVKDEEEITKLDKKLCMALSKQDGEGVVDESQFSLQGVDFVFSDEHEYSFFISGNSANKTEPGPLTMDRFNDFITSRSIDIISQLNKIKVTVHKEHSNNHSEPFKNFIEYINEKDKVCLIDGDWYIFNQSYIDYLKREVDSIVCDIGIHAAPLPLEDDFLETYVSRGYEIIHTKLETIDKKYSIEVGDMIKDDVLYVVKRGKPKVLNYAIDQAVASVNYIQENNGVVKVEGKTFMVKKVCIILLLSKKKPLKSLFDINSLIFHMKIIDWNRLTHNARIEPLVRVEQFTEN